MVPAITTSPLWRFTPSRFDLLSRPLRELPPPFLCAIVSLRRAGLAGRGPPLGGRRRPGGRLSLGGAGPGRLRRLRCGRLLGFGGGSCSGGNLGRRLSSCGLGRRTLAAACGCTGLAHLLDAQLGELAAVAEHPAAPLLGLVREDTQLAATA